MGRGLTLVLGRLLTLTRSLKWMSVTTLSTLGSLMMWPSLSFSPSSSCQAQGRRASEPGLAD